MYQEIINKIKSNLGENNELNRKYLTSQFDVYKNHPYGKEIIKEISRMLWDCLSDDEKQEFIELSDEENPVMDILDEIFPYIENGDYKNALEIMGKFMKTFPPMFEDDKVNEYHSFTNPLEEKIFDEYIGAEKIIRYIPNNKPLLDLYYVYGFLLLEDQQLENAEKYLKKALKINPVSSRIILELTEIYKKHTPNFNKFYIYVEEALKYAYYPHDIARCYRSLGYYYIEEEDFKTATALFKYSLQYDMSPMAYSELEYIKTKGVEFELSDMECEFIIQSKNIQVGPNPFIIKTINQLIGKYENENAFAQTIYFCEILYDLTLDVNLIEKINELKTKIKY